MYKEAVVDARERDPQTLWWFGREVAPSALAMFHVDELVGTAAPLYDVGGFDGVPAFTLEADDSIREVPSDLPVRLAMGQRTVPELEERARELILRASRETPPLRAAGRWWEHFDDRDILFQTFIYLPDENGQTVLVVATEPHFLGVVARDAEGRSGLLVFNVRGVVRVDTTDALPEGLPVLARRSEQRPLFSRIESRATRQDRFRAERKAKALLFRYLTREQKWELRAHNRVTVVGQDAQTYRIVAKYGMNVERLDAAGERVETLCVVPKNREPLPVFDLVLAHKILLQNQIDEFMRVANKFTIHQRTPAVDPDILAMLAP